MCSIDPRTLPDDGTNEHSVVWSELKPVFERFHGFFEGELDEGAPTSMCQSTM